LAVDRGNEKVAYLYEPAHPAVLRLIKQVIGAAHEAGIKVAMCGEMAGEPSLALILLGLGLDEFSVPPQVIPELKFIIRAIGFKTVQELASEAMRLSTGTQVEEFARKRLAEILQ